jgi:predicted DNA-binding transcriptional regulator AlpA
LQKEQEMILTIHDVSQLSKLSESTIRRLVSRREFPAPVHLAGRRNFWSERAVKDWIEKKIKASAVGGEYE